MWGMIRNSLGSPFGWQPGFPNENREQISTPDPTADAPVHPHEPTIKDVLVVKEMLKNALHLPLEITDSIIEQAEYWPHTPSFVKYEPDMKVAGRVYEGHEISEDEFLLRTPPLGFPKWPAHIAHPDDPPEGSRIEDSPRHISRIAAAPQPPGPPLPPDAFISSIGAPDTLLAHPCRKIVFTIRSRDQGWGGNLADHGTYNGSWTWFEAGLERWCQRETDNAGQQPSFDIKDICVVYPEVVSGREGDHGFNHPLHPVESLKIQCNEVASMHIKEHRVEWKYTDDVNPTDKNGAAKLALCGRGKATGDGKFVRELQLGDMVTVWAKARFPGWLNQVESVKVDVYWAV